MEERKYKGIWIPKEIWLSEELTLQEKVLLVEIDSLEDEEKGCYASNNYFARFFKLSPGRISQLITTLSKKQYINVEYIKNGKEIESRIIRIQRPPYPVFSKLNTYLENCNGGIKNTKEGYLENAKENNISINNINNNKKKVIKEKYFENEEVNDLFYEFLEFRKKLKAVNNDKAITLLINKLKDFDDSIKIKMINQSIENSWKSVFPLKKEYKKKENGYDIINRIIREEKEKNGKN